jgi:hypothetical protein
VFLSLRRGECNAVVGKAVDLKAVAAGLYRDRLTFTVFPETIALADAEAKLAAFAKVREDARKREAEQSAQRVAERKAAELIHQETLAKQDRFLPRCDADSTRDALKGAIERGAAPGLGQADGGCGRA